MQMLRQIYESVPNEIPVPVALRRRRVEVIMLPLDDIECPPVLSDEAQQQALQQLMQHAGAVQSGHPNAADNEQIDVAVLHPLDLLAELAIDAPPDLAARHDFYAHGKTEE